MIYQFVWTRGGNGKDPLEQAVPLVWHGEHLRKMGWRNNISLVFLEGLSHLSRSYLRRLEELGYQVHDCEPVAKRIARQYPPVRNLGMNPRYWFLRWNVLRYVAEKDRGSGSITHVDGDVVFMSDPEQLEEDVSGKTFILEGCPAFTSIHQMEWFDVWEKELSAFLSNPQEYIATAMAIKEAPPYPPREYCNDCVYVPGWFQDQDLLEYLAASGKIPQARTEEVFDSRYYWMANPLFPEDWFPEQSPGSERRIIERNEGSFVGTKQVALYHFQNDFKMFCHDWMNLNRIGLDRLIPYVKWNAHTRRLPLLGKGMRNFIHVADWKNRRRRKIYEMVYRINPRSGNYFITDIVNSCWNS